ncbi:MAG: hypothetical protein GY730_07110, partial [bacterium]|nr:hypothetical protein [bacterium]
MNKNPNKAPSICEQKNHEVADIFRIYGESYRQNHSLPYDHIKVMRHIEICRTAV